MPQKFLILNGAMRNVPIEGQWHGSKSVKVTPGGDLIFLRKAKDDVLNAGQTPSSTLKATQKLMIQIEDEINRLEKKERKQFSAGFEKALAGKFE